MEKFRSSNVAELRNLCKDAGLPSSGNKNTLIKRLEAHVRVDEHYLSASSVLSQRVAELEKTMREMEQRQNDVITSSFVPQCISSPIDTQASTLQTNGAIVAASVAGTNLAGASSSANANNRN